MGLLNNEIVNILRTVKANGISGKSIIMIGKQDLNIDMSVMLKTIKNMGIDYDISIAEELLKNEFLDSFLFFRMLGFSEVSALDYSDFEGADICFDLNNPLPEEYIERYDYVLNGGTIEHVFNIAQAVNNISKMVKKGGFIIHISPVAGWINHGFYSISPSFFQDYLISNGFDIMQIEFEGVYDYNRKVPNSISSGDLRFIDNSVELNKFEKKSRAFDEDIKVLLFVIAQRVNTEISYENPIQGFYQDVYGSKNQHVLVETISFRKWANEISNTDGKVSVYGCGDVCNRLLDELYRIGAEKKISCIYDGNPQKAGFAYRGIQIQYPISSRVVEEKIIYICNANYENDIERSLIEKGVSKDKIRKTSEYVHG